MHERHKGVPAYGRGSGCLAHAVKAGSNPCCAEHSTAGRSVVTLPMIEAFKATGGLGPAAGRSWSSIALKLCSLLSPQSGVQAPCFSLGGLKSIGWPHKIQLGEPNCWGPEALPRQNSSKTSHTHIIDRRKFHQRCGSRPPYLRP
jgi:hypothetical protein